MQKGFFHQHYHHVLAGVVGLAFWGALPGLGQAIPINCGDQVGPGGTYTLEADVTCVSPDPESPDPGFTLVGPVTLNMKGHTLTCGTGTRFGIVMSGQANVRNGTVVGCEEGVLVNGAQNVIKNLEVSESGAGIHLEAADDNELRNNTLQGNGLGFWLSDGSDRNLLHNNTATDHSDVGFYLDGGAQNQLKENISTNNRSGFGVTAQTGTQLIKNTAVGNVDNGFSVSESTDTTLQKNAATGNGLNGIFVLEEATHNFFIKNTAVGNSAIDLVDENPDCDDNLWKANTFGSKSQACIQ